jgi:hypothetical protein
MAETLVPYFVAGTILFFFWAYGLVSFVLDLQNKVVPGLLNYYRTRQRERESREQERQREEREKQLY